MDTSNKSGRTFWDLVAENKSLFLLLFVIFVGVTIWLVKTGTTVKTIGMELTPKQDTIFIKEMPSELPTTKYTKSNKSTIKPQKLTDEEIGNLSNNSFGDSNSITSSPVKIENNGINKGIMAKEVNTYLGSPQRNMDEDWEAYFKKVPIGKRDTFFIEYPMNDVESAKFAEQVFNFYKKEGFVNVRCCRQSLFDKPVYGIRLERHSGYPHVVIGSIER